MAVYEEYRPTRELAPFVECGWARSSTDDCVLRVIPDGCVDVFVTAGGTVMVSGPATTFYDQRADGGGLLTGLRLRPGAAAAVTGHSAGELRDRRVSMDSILGVSAAELTDRVMACTSSRQRVATLETMLCDYFAASEPMLDRSVAHTITTLHGRPESSVPEMASAVGLSERQLRRRFDAAVGYGPKRLGRIFRLQRLLDVLHGVDDRVRWAEAAAEAGFADQSHMIHECLALAGSTPTGLPGAGSRPPS